MITTYQQALDYFSPHEKVSKHYNLEAIRAVCKKLGNPQYSYKIIHVAGTNGKGSTSQMCFSIFKHRGKKVGLFTSPHLLDIRERFRTQNGIISQEDLINIVNKIIGLGIVLTYFEKCTLIAFEYFRQQGCEYVVIEVGIGGLHDSTNIVKPTITTITSIGYDHMNVLGDTIEEISAQKAGIIKPGIPLVLNMRNAVIEQQAKSVDAPIIFTDKTVATNLIGDHQTKNAALAYEITHYLGVPDETINKGLQHVSHPGRLDYLFPNLLIDGAHNEQGLKSLKTYIDTITPKYRQIIYCFSTKHGKEQDIRHHIIERFGVKEQYIIVDRDHYLLATTTDIADACEGISYTIHTPEEIVQSAQADKNTLYVVFGSLYMIGGFYQS